MLVGATMFFQNLHGLPDHEFVTRELKIGVVAEEVGFDWVMAPEHHFEDYSQSVDNIQIQTWMAANTKNIKLMLGAVILPWHDPIRVAERVLMLDAMSGGRVLLGFGRGLSAREYGALGVDMNESRERFDESAAMLVDALESGFIEGDGQFYPQPRTELRPRPFQTFKGRTLSVAMSPASGLAAAELGLGILCFVTGDLSHLMPIIEPYRERYLELHRVPAPPPVLSDYVFCHEDHDYAEEVMREHYMRTYLSTEEHYDFTGDHFARTKGYESYAEVAEQMRQASITEVVQAAMDAQSWGTPSEVIEKVQARRRVVGDFHALFTCSFGGLPHDMVYDSLRLVGTQVKPVISALGHSSLAPA